MTPRRDPDARCGSCGIRLSRVDRDHEEHCGRAADGWPPFEDDDPIHPENPLAARRAAHIETVAPTMAPDQEAARAA